MLLSMVKDIRVILIKFCDRLHNMRTLESLPEHRRLKIALETRDIYAPLAHRFGLGKMKMEFENLALRYIDPEMFAFLQKKVQLTRVERENYLSRMIAPITDDLQKQGFTVEVQGVRSICSPSITRCTAKTRPMRIFMTSMAYG